MPEEHIIQKYHLPSHDIFNLLNQLNQLYQNIHFLASDSFQCIVVS